MTPRRRQARHPRPRRHPQRLPRRPRQVARGVGADPGRARGGRAAEPRRLAHGGRHQPVGHRPRAVRHGVAQRHAPAHDDQRCSRKVGGRIDAVFFCPHAPEDDCDCRKPLPGLMRADRRALRHRRCATCRWSATRCATCRPAPPPAASRTWCAPASGARLDDEQLAADPARRCPARRCTPTWPTFADFLLQRERKARGESRRGRLRLREARR